LRSKNIGFKDSTERVNFFKVYNILDNGINNYFKRFKEDSRKLHLDTFILDKKIFTEILERKILALKKINEPKANLFSQHLISFQNYIPALLKGIIIDSSSSDAVKVSPNLRDSLMAENIIWLANKQYPDKKIIIWAASYHNARHKSVGYGNMEETLMGDYLKPALEKISYSIAFTTYEGFFGRYNSKDSSVIDKSSVNSFEELFSKLGTDNFFLDFKTLSKTKNGNWLTKPKIMRPLGYREQEKNWTLVFDAVIFNRKMTKAHSIF
jgi:erythromycin esterase